MGVGEPFANSGNKVNDLLFINGPAMEGFMEGLSVDEFHHDVEHVVDLPKVVDADKVGMVQFGHSLGLVLESPAEVLVLPEFARQDFDRDIPLKRFLVGLIDCTHATFRYEREDIIGRKKLLKLLGSRGLELRRCGHGNSGCGESAGQNPSHGKDAPELWKRKAISNSLLRYG